MFPPKSEYHPWGRLVWVGVRLRKSGKGDVLKAGAGVGAVPPGDRLGRRRWVCGWLGPTCEWLTYRDGLKMDGRAPLLNFQLNSHHRPCPKPSQEILPVIRSGGHSILSHLYN
ncbi:hypothetical protein AVEN_182849-1 [Araneus ventricosus]|uniref:Uncharacterized protein n=1 Tax=Araneus ventricosus TaxID=182803 RepID=A0A4Y2CEU4_ARAVE|nr:hypothetical protein AVEN_182849-1 [Araneus ventricosus]